MHLRKNTTLLLELILKANSFKVCFQANFCTLIYLAAVNYWNFYLSNSTLKLAYRTEKEKRDNFYSLTVDIASSEFRCYCITTRLLR